MKHTRGWTIRAQDIYDTDGMYVATWSGTIKKAQRIINCVNGCAGIENPLAVGELLEAYKKTLDIINSYSHIPAQFEACQTLQQAINKVEKET